MELYIRFMVTLSCGLLGVGMVLKVLLDGLFHEWDAVADLEEFVKGGWHSRQRAHGRAEDVMLDAENARARSLSSSPYEQKRRELKEISRVELKINHPTPVTLTPIPSSPFEISPS